MEPNLASYAAWNVADYLLETGLFAKAIEFYEECFVLLRICITSGLERTIQKRTSEVERQLYMGLANAYWRSKEGEIDVRKMSRDQQNLRDRKKTINLDQCKKSLAFHKKALELR